MEGERKEKEEEMYKKFFKKLQRCIVLPYFIQSTNPHQISYHRIFDKSAE